MAFGLYELETARAICRLLSPGDTFIDVGANIGYFSTLAAKRVGSAGNVHAFEPSPANRSRLVENVNINMLGPVVNIHAEALSDYNGELHLHEYCVAGANHGQATAFPLAHRTRVTHACAVRLDDLLPHLTPRLVKLDVEGSELAAIMGMRSMLARAAPALIVEINPVTCKVANFSPSDLVSAILSVVPNHGCWLLRGRPKRIDPTPHELDPLGEVNLLFDLPERCPCS